LALRCGLHHVTAIASGAQANFDFYIGVLGLRPGSSAATRCLGGGRMRERVRGLRLGGARRRQREMLNLLRFLGNELRIPLVCQGTREA